MNLDAPNGHIHRSTADNPEPEQPGSSTGSASGEDSPTAATVERLSASERMALVEQTHPSSAIIRSQSSTESGGSTESTAPERMMHLEQQQFPPQIFRSANDETTETHPDKLPRGPDDLPRDNAVSAPSDSVKTTTGSASDRRDTVPSTTRDNPSHRVIQDACKKWGVDTDEGHAAVQRSYDVVKNKVAPFLVKHMAKMIDDCNAEVLKDPDRLYAFLGRDGYCLATVVATLDPDLYIKHCITVPVTRVMLEPALQDDEANAGKKFGIDAFRKYKDTVSADEIHEAKFRLTAHLENNGLPVNEAGRNITVIDTSRKGSTQEGLAALYPHINWFGRYLVFEQSPADPHPDTKIGYALNNDSTGREERPEAAVTPQDPEKLPEDRHQTFAHPDAILCIEDLVHGPWPSPRLGTDGQSPPRGEMPPVDELNPLDISPAFQDPATRIAAAEAMVVAVRDCAYEVMRQRDEGEDWRAELDGKTEVLVDDLRAWISGGEVDDDMAEVFGAFVRRSDRPHVAQLRAAITAHGLDPAGAERVWRGYKQARSLGEKQDYVAEYKKSMEQP